MKLSCTQENLNRGLNIVNKIIGLRGTLPVLNNILLATDGGRLKLSSTDLEIGINVWIGAKIEEEGSITIPARLICDYTNTNDDKKINLNLKDTTLELKSEKYQAHIKGIDASEFPLIPKIKEVLNIQLSAKKLQEGIRKILFACAVDETRPVLTGVLLKIKNNTLFLVATDSYRLSEVKINLEKKPNKEISLIIPSRTMAEVGRVILTQPNSDIVLRLDENQILFDLGETQIISRLIEGNYPDYEQIIPQSYKTEVVVKVGEFTNVIKMASFFAREAANNVKLKLQNTKMIVSAISPQVGDSVSNIDITKKGENVEVAFNAKFVLDFLNTIDEEEIIIQTNSPTNPAILKGGKDKNYFYLLMPLKVEE